MTTLSDLIARLEAAKNGNQKLGDAVLLACGWRKSPNFDRDNPQPYWIRPDGQNVATNRPNPTTSLDAALTLKPNGWQCGFEEAGCADHVRRPEAWCWPNDFYWEQDWQNGEEGYRSHPNATRAVAETPTLAMCAAILKAREAGR